MSEYLRVYEHQRLVVARSDKKIRSGAQRITEETWELLARYKEITGSNAYEIGYQSIKIGHYVGFLQIGNLYLEFLPKLGRREDRPWAELLVYMIADVLQLRIKATGMASLQSRPRRLFDILIDRFLDLVELRIREGLARGYREVRGNRRRLQGRLLIEEQVRHNLVHKERLFVAHQVFDADILANRILSQALNVVVRISGDSYHRHRAAVLLASFPEEVGNKPIQRSDFDRLVLDRRTKKYEEAIEIARLLLFGERPEMKWGGRPVMALLFDMNVLFESYVVRQAQRVKGWKVRSQLTRVFWTSNRGRKNLRPDLLFSFEETGSRIVADVKWKIPKHGMPTSPDLRQLYSYLHLLSAHEGFLIYPRAAKENEAQKGVFFDEEHRAGIVFLELFREGRPCRDATIESLREVLEWREEYVELERSLSRPVNPVAPTLEPAQ